MKTEMRRELARQPFQQKIRKVARLIQLRQKVKTAQLKASEDAVLLDCLDEPSRPKLQ